LNPYLGSLTIQYLTPSSKLPYMIEMAPSRKSVNQATAAPTDLKEKGKLLKQLSRRTIGPTYLTSISLSWRFPSKHCLATWDADRRTRAIAKRRPTSLDAFHHVEAYGEPADGDNLLREVATHRKEAAACVQTRLLEQIGTINPRL